MVYFYVYFDGVAELPLWLDKCSRTLEPRFKCVTVCPVDSERRRILTRFANELEDSGAEISGHLLSAHARWMTDKWVRKRDLKKSELFALATYVFFLGFETRRPATVGCRLCGEGRRISKSASLDPLSVLSWQFGFTNTGRLVVHVDEAASLVAQGFRGFAATPMPSQYDELHLLTSWTGSLEGAQRIVDSVLPTKLPGVTVVDGCEHVYVLASEEAMKSPAMRSAIQELQRLDAEDHMSYAAIPPARTIEGVGTSRWFGLTMEGPELEEQDFNEYDKRFLCPLCGEGGKSPLGSLKIRRDSWDGRDFCRTDAGRLCVSRRVIQFLQQFGEVPAQPVEWV